MIKVSKSGDTTFDKYSPNEKQYLQSIIDIQKQDENLRQAIQKESQAMRKAKSLFNANVDLAESGNVSKTSYISADATSSLSGRSRGGSQSKAITINITAPIVQIDSTHIDNKQYTAQQIGEIAAKELINIMSQVAVL